MGDAPKCEEIIEENEYCEHADLVPFGAEYWRCPECDAEWVSHFDKENDIQYSPVSP